MVKYEITQTKLDEIVQAILGGSGFKVIYFNEEQGIAISCPYPCGDTFIQLTNCGYGIILSMYDDPESIESNLMYYFFILE